VTLDLLPVESDFAALLAEGHSRTRATELATERALTRSSGAATAVLVEGLSDQIVLELLAARLGRNLGAEGIAVVPMAGATNVARFVSLLGPRGRGCTLAGLYDSGEEDHVRRALEAAGHGRDLTGSGLESLGFFACVRDLEDELIRCVGVSGVESILEHIGELRSFRTMQREPHHRTRDVADQLHRFIGRQRYRNARLLAESVDLRSIPAPVGKLLRHLDSAWRSPEYVTGQPGDASRRDDRLGRKGGSWR
jgi:hypothetical protein